MEPAENSAFHVHRIIAALGAQNKETLPLDLIAHVVVVFRAPPDKAKHWHTVCFTESHQLRDTAKWISLMGAH